MKKQTKGQECKQYVLKLCRIREILLKKGLSKKNSYWMAENTLFLGRHLRNVAYTEEGLIRFFIRHADKIESILPGRDSKCGSKLQDEYNKLYDEAVEISFKLKITC